MPKNIGRFEKLMWAAIVVGAVRSIFLLPHIARMPATAALGGWFFVIPVAVASTAIFVLLIWLVARRRKNWARWVLLAFFILGMPEVFLQLLASLKSGDAFKSVMAVTAVLLQAAAFYFVFTGDAKDWFKRKPRVSEPASDMALHEASLASSGMEIAQPAVRGGSYIARHWRGELSLPVSYWVNGLLVSVAAVVAVAALGSIDITRAPRLLTGAYATLAIFLLVVSVWQLVGVWRSAGRTIQERKRQQRSTAWAILARVATVVGFLSLVAHSVEYTLPNAVGNLKIAFGYDNTPHHILKIVNNGSEIVLAGGIDFGTAADLRVLLNATPGVRTIDLDSLGGRVAEARQVRDLIRERQLATYADAECASACTIIYMAGHPRYLGPGGKLGFHRYYFPGLTPRQTSIINNRGKQNLIKAGVSAAFADRAFSTPHTTIWIPDRATLLSAHVVTRIVDGMSFAAAAADGGKPVTNASVDKTLAAVPSFGALKRADPTAYTLAVARVVSGIENGKSLRQVMAGARAFLLPDVAKFRRIAADDVQVKIAKLTAEEGLSLAEGHPDLCVAMLTGTSHGGVSYTAFLPHHIQEEDAEVTAAIIDGGSARPSHVIDTPNAAVAEIRSIWSRLRDDGVDLSAVGKRPETPQQQRAMCIADSRFMGEVAELPLKRAGALMRYFSNRH